jgi:phosphatidate cytidylyltransferase
VILLSFCCELIALYKVRDRWTLLGILLTAWIADIFAYFSGRAFGRHKLAPSISPGKTWEGAIGAVVGVALYWVICFSGRLDWKETLLLVGIAVLATVMCILGDLFESLIKRQAGVKDSSNLLPGHGGILDRIDSWLPLFAFFTMVVVWVGWFD